MKLIIDLPDEVKTLFDNADLFELKDYYDFNSTIGKAIKNGTPLPKGHGKLVDIEDVKDNIRKWRGYLDEDMMTRINFTMDNNIPTIIESDKIESEK